MEYFHFLKFVLCDFLFSFFSMSKKLELLFPAGNLEKLKYAIAYGADAVYA